jgi:hypothetical protein
MCNMTCQCIGDKISSGLSFMAEGISFIATAWIPKKPWTIAAVGFAGWYGHQVALTYAPGIIADYLIKTTAAYLAVGGTVLGVTVVAPMLTPTIVPLVAVAASLAFMYIVGLIVNLIQKLLCDSCCQRQEQDPLEQDPLEQVVIES